jgi:hypothetical protein
MTETDPNVFGPAGRRLWEAVTGVYELDEHEAVLLREAARTVDLLDVLAARVAADGPVLETPAGPRVHPAAVEARQARIALARLVAALRLPDGDAGDASAGRRPQRRAGARGVYGLRVVE